MAVAFGDVLRSIIRLWDENNLDDLFSQWWTESQVDEYPAILTSTAAENQPFPYCVLHIREPVKSTLMSHDPNLREVRKIVGGFFIYGEEENVLDGEGNVIGSVSPGNVLSQAIEGIMKVFGGHPTVHPQIPVLDNGEVLQLEYMHDYFREQKASERRVAQDENVSAWELVYEIMVDVPMV